MKFGVFFEMSTPMPLTGGIEKQVFDNALEQARLERAERLHPDLRHFDAAGWGDPRLEPSHPVSASTARAQIEIPPVRFLCRPGELTFTGTESVLGQPTASEGVA